jgi:hypothetical protein
VGCPKEASRGEWSAGQPGGGGRRAELRMGDLAESGACESLRRHDIPRRDYQICWHAPYQISRRGCICGGEMLYWKSCSRVARRRGPLAHCTGLVEGRMAPALPYGSSDGSLPVELAVDAQQPDGATAHLASPNTATELAGAKGKV